VVLTAPRLWNLAQQPVLTGRLVPFAKGNFVVVQGLTKLPEWNGCPAVVQGWDATTGRYDIVVTSPSGIVQAKIKEDNLRQSQGNSRQQIQPQFQYQ